MAPAAHMFLKGKKSDQTESNTQNAAIKKTICFPNIQPAFCLQSIETNVECPTCRAIRGWWAGSFSATGLRGTTLCGPTSAVAKAFQLLLLTGVSDTRRTSAGGRAMPGKRYLVHEALRGFTQKNVESPCSCTIMANQ